VVVSNEIELVLDVEAINLDNLDDLERTGAIEHYRLSEPQARAFAGLTDRVGRPGGARIPSRAAHVSRSEGDHVQQQ